MMEDNQSENVDVKLLTNAAVSIINSEQGADVLAKAAGNADNPAVGVAQYIMMLMQSIEQMLTQAGVDDVDYSAWLAPNGAVEMLLPDIVDALEGGGVQLSDAFPGDLMNALLERIKGAAQAEEGQAPTATPQAPAAAPAADAGLLGMV